MLALALAGLASVDLRTLQKLESELNALIPAASHASELAPLGLELEDAADDASLERRRFDEQEIENALEECNEPFAENACAAGYSALMRWYSEKKCPDGVCPGGLTCSPEKKCIRATPQSAEVTKQCLVNIQHQCKSRTMASWPEYPKGERLTTYIDRVKDGIKKSDPWRGDVLSWVCNLSPGHQDHGFVEPLVSWDAKGSFDGPLMTEDKKIWNMKKVELEKPDDENSALRERRCVKVMQIGMYRYLIAATVADNEQAAPKDATDTIYGDFWDLKGVKEPRSGGRGAAYPVAIRLAASTDDDKPEHTTNYVDGVLRACPPAAPARSPRSAGLVRHSGCG